MHGAQRGHASLERRQRHRLEPPVRGALITFTVTRVMTPSVPSEPTKSWVSYGPTAWRGTGTVSMTSPVGVTTRSATRRSSIFP